MQITKLSQVLKFNHEFISANDLCPGVELTESETHWNTSRKQGLMSRDLMVEAKNFYHRADSEIYTYHIFLYIL